MRKERKITTMDTQERYFQNSLGHPSLPTALFFLADPRALIGSNHPLQTCRALSGHVAIPNLRPLNDRRILSQSKRTDATTEVF